MITIYVLFKSKFINHIYIWIIRIHKIGIAILNLAYENDFPLYLHKQLIISGYNIIIPKILWTTWKLKLIRLYIKEQIIQNNKCLQCISSSLKSMKELYW